MKLYKLLSALLAAALLLGLAAAGIAEAPAREAAPAEAESAAIEQTSGEGDFFFAPGSADGQADPTAADAAPGTDVEGAPADAVERVAFDEAEAGYAGTWVTFEDGFKLYLPSEWVSYEVTDEEAEVGLFYRAGNGGSDGIVGDIPVGVAVSYVSAGDLQTLDDLVRDFEALGFANLRKRDANGMPAMAFEKPEDGYRGVSFFHPSYSGYVMTVYFTPLGEAESAVDTLGRTILDSLSPWSDVFEE